MRATGKIEKNKKYLPFFSPHSLIIIGASRNERTFNGTLLKNLLRIKYEGSITLIHPYAEHIQGIPCIKKLEDLPPNHSYDLAILLTFHDMDNTLEFLAKRGTRHFVIESDVSVIKDKEIRENLVKKIREIAQHYNLLIMGPSMIGIIDFTTRFTTSIIPVRKHILDTESFDGPGISFYAQSGGLSGACGWWKPAQAIPFARVIHMGKALTVKEEDMFEYLLNDPHTGVLTLYLKRIPENFVSILREYYQREEKDKSLLKHEIRYGKPVLFKYIGDPQDPMVKQFINAGAIKVEAYSELFEIGRTFLWSSPPKNNGVGIIGPSSGAINLLVSKLSEEGLKLGTLRKQTIERILKEVGGSTGPTGNPVDYWPPSEFIEEKITYIYRNASDALLSDPSVEILMLALEFFVEIEFDFTIYEELRKKYPHKTIICVLIQAENEGGRRVIEEAEKAHIPVFVDEPERAVKAAGLLYRFYNKNERKA